MGRQMLKELRRGDAVNEIYLVESANYKQARNGKPFIQMVLRDASAAVKALRWEANRDEYRQLERHPFVQVHGRVEEYQGALQIVVDEMDSLSEQDARVNTSDFLPRTRFAIDDLERRFFAVARAIEDPCLREIVDNVLARPGVRQGLLAAPAGKVLHHAWIGGLLEHIVSLAELSRRVLEQYPWLDRDMLLAGVLLHDIGKVEELTYQKGFGYSDDGQLVGHIAMALSWIDEAAKGKNGADAARVRELKHLVASHHGKLEFGSPKPPMTAEALALHFLDNLDAKLISVLDGFDAAEAQLADDRWGDFNAMLGARVYFPPGMEARVAAWRNSIGAPSPAAGKPAPAKPAPAKPAEPAR